MLFRKNFEVGCPVESTLKNLQATKNWDELFRTNSLAEIWYVFRGIAVYVFVHFFHDFLFPVTCARAKMSEVSAEFGVIPLPSLDDFFLLYNTLRIFGSQKQLCWRLYATEPTLPVRDLQHVGLVGSFSICWSPVVSRILIVATAKTPSQVVSRISQHF